MRAFGPHIVPSPEQVVRRALLLASVGTNDLICVAGPDGLDAMVSLCRAGFERVECARQATCAGADEACQLLLIVGRTDAQALSDTVARTARLLADGGLLIAQLSRLADEAGVRHTLRALGFEAPSSVFDRSATPLVLLTVRRAAALRKAG